jgi:hypothetical protein
MFWVTTVTQPQGEICTNNCVPDPINPAIGNVYTTGERRVQYPPFLQQAREYLRRAALSFHLLRRNCWACLINPPSEVTTRFAFSGHV